MNYTIKFPVMSSLMEQEIDLPSVELGQTLKLANPVDENIEYWVIDRIQGNIVEVK